MEPRIIGLYVNPQGGVPKHAVETLRVTPTGCDGDRQNDLKHHGGPTRAVCLMLESVMKKLISEGHPIGPGTTGENILIQGSRTKFHQGRQHPRCWNGEITNHRTSSSLQDH